MQIVRELADIAGTRDLVRRAMSKKKADVMEAEGKNFIYGAKDGKGKHSHFRAPSQNGIPERVAKEIFET
jgi:DNA polymerase-3 subunit alpha